MSCPPLSNTKHPGSIFVTRAVGNVFHLILWIFKIGGLKGKGETGRFAAEAEFCKRFTAASHSLPFVVALEGLSQEWEMAKSHSQEIVKLKLFKDVFAGMNTVTLLVFL